jgi:glutamate-1-semialdehyde 2,1-aminomutase
MDGAPHDLFVVEWNDTAALTKVMDQMAGSVAAVVMEPVMGNAGVIPPQPGYLDRVREITRRHGTLLIFDEVITGFRVAAGGARELYGVVPDITVVSKALGGGIPIAAFRASAEIMELISSGKLFHGGVYSGNALVLAAANAVLTHVLAEKDSLYAQLNARSTQLATGIREVLTRYGIPHVVQHVGPMIACILTMAEVGELNSYREVRRHADFARYIELEHALLDRGVFMHPNQFEPMYLSTAHSKQDIDEVLGRFDEAIRHCFC